MRTQHPPRKKPGKPVTYAALLPSGEIVLRRSARNYLCLVAWQDGQSWHIARWSRSFLHALRLCRQIRCQSVTAVIIRTYIVE